MSYTLPALFDALPFSALDRAFVCFVQDRLPSDDPRHTWLALLVSHQFGRGHARLELDSLPQQPDAVLGWTSAQCQLLPHDLAAALDSLPWGQSSGTGSPLVLQGRSLYLRRAWQAEQDIRAGLLARVQTPVQDAATADLRTQLDQLFPPQADQPQDWQKIACALAARGRLLLLTGGPGTGKTTTVARLLALLQWQASTAGQPLRIHLAAPTGKAAARLSASLQAALERLPDTFRAPLLAHPPAEAQTLHRLLRLQPTARQQTPEPLATDLVVVDEASMIDLEMMARLLACVPLSARLVLLGDKDQLASVEAGAVWAQLCEGAAEGHYDVATVAWLQQQAGHDVSAWAVPMTAPVITRAANATVAQTAQLDLWGSPEPSPLSLPWAQHTAMLRHSRRFAAGGGIGQWAACLNQGDAAITEKLWHTLPSASPAAMQAATESATEQDAAQDETSPEVLRMPADTTPRSAAWAQVLRQGWANWLQALAPWRLADASDSSSAPALDDATARHLLNAFGQFQILCAVREGPWGVQHINHAAALALQCPAEGWYAGRPVMVTRNDATLGLMNGDVGLCLPKDGRLRVAFPVGDAGVRWVAASRLEAVDTVFAMTVHKSQGSEYEQVLLVLPDQLNPVLTRELLYTGLTRAKRRAIWHVPAPDVLFQAVTRRVWRSGGLGLAGWHNAEPTRPV